MKKYVTVLFLALFACFAAMSVQAEVIVIGDFEGPGTAQLDGWSVTGANSAFAGDDIGAVWSSTGNGSLAILFQTANTFQWNLQYTNLEVLSQLANSGGAMVLADVYWLTSDWNGTEGWVRWDVASLNSNQGWKQTNDSLMGDTANPGSPGGWDPVNWGASNQRTISWDFSTLLEGATPQDIVGGGWAQLNLSVNGDTGPDTSGIMYIDNIRLETIPEPATLLLLGLGGLMLRRRRA